MRSAKIKYMDFSRGLGELWCPETKSIYFINSHYLKICPYLYFKLKHGSDVMFESNKHGLVTKIEVTK